MLQFVLFLLAILIIIIIFKILPRKTWKWIGYVFLALVVISAGLVGIAFYNDHQSSVRWEAKQAREIPDMLTYLCDVDKWGNEHSEVKNGYHWIDSDKLSTYAADLYDARNYSFYFNEMASNYADRKVTTTLTSPLNGVSEIQIRYSASLLDSDAIKAVKNGYTGGFMIHIYSLDGSQYYNGKEWVKPVKQQVNP